MFFKMELKRKLHTQIITFPLCQLPLLRLEFVTSKGLKFSKLPKGQSGVRLRDGRFLYTAPCAFRTK